MLVFNFYDIDSNGYDHKLFFSWMVESESYNRIINIDNWEDYFKRTKKKLKMELESLREKVKQNNN